MKIQKIAMEHFNEIVNLAYETYQAETKHNPELYPCTKSDLNSSIRKAIEKQTGVVYTDHDKVLGFLIYNSSWEDSHILHYHFPIWGYGAVNPDRAQILSRLFESLADKLLQTTRIHLEVKLYAHDEEIIKLFSFLQFGIQCEESLRDTSTPITNTAGIAENNILFKELSKQELNNRWQEIWPLLAKLILHLRKSPVFYPGNEFTEEVYHEFLADPDTRVFAAEKDHKIIGIIEANSAGNSFITQKPDCYNIGDIFVSEEYRDQKTAAGLLKFTNDTLAKEQISRLWVEHGTANPNARGFWNKYFSSYAYTMLREIDSL